MEHELNHAQSVDDAAKNRRVFNDVDLLWGMPKGIALVGVVLCVGMYAATRTLLAPIILAPAYFIPMYAIHKDDVRGLTIWLSVLGDKVTKWEAGRRTPLSVLLLDRGS